MSATNKVQTQYKVTSYTIDNDDVLVSVGAFWESFALDNEGDELMSRNVIGKSLWNFVTDEATVSLYKEMLTKVRSGRDVHFTFRCDSPNVRRFLEMNITQADRGTVQFETVIDLIEERESQALYERNTDGTEPVVVTCSWCKNIQIDRDTWVEVEAAVEVLDLFAQDRTPRLSHGICPECYKKVRKGLDEE